MNNSLGNKSSKGWFFKTTTSTSDPTLAHRSAWQKGSSFSPGFQWLCSTLTKARSSEKQLPVENDPIKCGGLQLQAATHPHPFSSLESISVELKCFCGRQLSVILDMAGQGSVILCHQRWALVACSPLDAVLYNMAVYLGFMFFLCFQVSKWKHCCVCFLAMLWGEKKKKKNFCEKGRKGDGTAFKAQIPLSKTYQFPAVPKNKPKQTNFCPASLWLDRAMKIYSLPILSWFSVPLMCELTLITAKGLYIPRR